MDYEDTEGQRKRTAVRFTAADYVMCGRRYRRFCNPQAGSGAERLLNLADWLEFPVDRREHRRPEALGLDPDNRLYRVILDEKITARALDASEARRSLRKLARIGNSHVQRALNDARFTAPGEPAPGEAAAIDRDEANLDELIEPASAFDQRPLL